MQTGYAYIFPPEWDVPGETSAEWIANRVRELGLFHKDYLLFNLMHFFVQGPDVEFSGRYLTQMSGFGDKGIALFIARRSCCISSSPSGTGTTCLLL